MFGSRIKLDKDLLTKIKRYAKIAGYSSPDEFVSHALEKELAKLEGADSEEESALGIGATVELQNVKVVAESVLGLCCRITGRDHWIAPRHLLVGSSVAHFGDRGSIILARQFAEDRGLLSGRFPPL